LHNRDEVTLTLKKEGEGLVRASDIELPHDVEIVNPDHLIAHLTAGGRLELQLKVEKGRGYVAGNVRAFGDDHSKTIGRVVMDASFSPVRRVSYTVESARVEQRTDLDKLVMTIETNGAIGPEEAVRQSARILVEQLSVFAALEGTAEPVLSQRTSPSVDPILLRAGRRPGADREVGQLPEGREYLLHRRPDPAHRKRAAEDAEPGPQVAQRDQGSPGGAGTDSRDEAGELAAGRSGEVTRESPCATDTA